MNQNILKKLLVNYDVYNLDSLHLSTWLAKELQQVAFDVQQVLSALDESINGADAINFYDSWKKHVYLCGLIRVALKEIESIYKKHDLNNLLTAYNIKKTWFKRVIRRLQDKRLSNVVDFIESTKTACYIYC